MSIIKKYLRQLPGAMASSMPGHISPMLGELRPEPFSGSEWIFEPKLDGFRIIGFIEYGNVTLKSRNNTDMTRYFPAIASDLKELVGTFPSILDGEIVAIDEAGTPCFQCLQQHVSLPHEHTGKQFSTIYFIFDILFFNGFNLMNVPWEARNFILHQIGLSGAHLKLVEHQEGDGFLIFKTAVDAGMEGVVAKKKLSL